MTSRDEEQPEPAGTQRIDKWLWYARVAKSRTLAADLVIAGKVRVNRTRAVKASQSVRPGDVLTIALRGHVQVLKVLAPGLRRGSPVEARQLYESIGPPPAKVVPGSGERDRGTGRPSKRDRRLTDKLTEDG
jgi:ribosome-associated heat shock protein Hsp15